MFNIIMGCSFYVLIFMITALINFDVIFDGPIVGHC